MNRRPIDTSEIRGFAEWIRTCAGIAVRASGSFTEG
jgi:hypothetical protein